jgi:hypothetical protein
MIDDDHTSLSSPSPGNPQLRRHDISAIIILSMTLSFDTGYPSDARVGYEEGKLLTCSSRRATAACCAASTVTLHE